VPPGLVECLKKVAQDGIVEVLALNFPDENGGVNGGIPPVSGVWWEDDTYDNKEGTLDWVNATDLTNYMTSTIPSSIGTPYWSAYSSMSSVVPGDVLYHPPVNGTTAHVMIAVYGDGLSSAWDGHTNDDYHVPVSSNYGTFYHVSDWVWGP